MPRGKNRVWRVLGQSGFCSCLRKQQGHWGSWTRSQRDGYRRKNLDIRIRKRGRNFESKLINAVNFLVKNTKKRSVQTRHCLSPSRTRAVDDGWDCTAKAGCQIASPVQSEFGFRLRLFRVAGQSVSMPQNCPFQSDAARSPRRWAGVSGKEARQSPGVKGPDVSRWSRVLVGRHSRAKRTLSQSP